MLVEHLLTQLTVNIRRGLKYIILGLLAVLILGVIYVQRFDRQNVFLREINKQLARAEYQLHSIIETSYTDEESLSTDLRLLVYRLVRIETTLSNGHKFVSQTIPNPDELHGFALIISAIFGGVSSDYGEEFSQMLLSQQERTFLEELLEAITELKVKSGEKSTWYNFNALGEFAEIYRQFNDTWQIDSIRTPSGVSPFDVLKLE